MGTFLILPRNKSRGFEINSKRSNGFRWRSLGDCGRARCLRPSATRLMYEGHELVVELDKYSLPKAKTNCAAAGIRFSGSHFETSIAARHNDQFFIVRRRERCYVLTQQWLRVPWSSMMAVLPVQGFPIGPTFPS